MLDERYETAISLNQVFLDKDTGEPLNGYAEFFEDNSRSTPKLVYQLSGAPPNYTYVALPNPVRIVNGVCVDNSGANTAIYAFPYDDLGNLDLYYVKIFSSNVDTGDILQEQRQAWPNITAGDDPTRTENSITNELSNSQFVEVLFNDQYGVSISTGGAVTNAIYDIAPDWQLIVSSNSDATIAISRTAIAGSSNVITNPPYQLEIDPQSGSITSLKLSQKLNNNPDIWSNGFIAGSIVAASLDGIPHTIELVYAPSIAPASNIILTGVTGDSGYTRFSGTIELDAGTNTDAPPDGYVLIQIILPTNGEMAITSVQVVGLNNDEEDVLYDQQTVNRQEDYLFHYYNSLIQAIPVPSIIQGWDFKVNPAQFGSSVSMGAVASQYLWDQLIGFQSANSLLSVSRAVPRALTVSHAGSAGQIALIQYIDGSDLNQLLSNEFSVLIKAYTDLAAGIGGTVSFWQTTDATLPNVAAGTNLSLVQTLDANGKPTAFHGNWTEIPRNYRGDARFTIPFNGDALWQPIAINGWNRSTNAINGAATYGAIVVGFEASSSAHNIVVDSISVTPGALAVPVAPMPYNLTLLALQKYYEKSYGEDVYAGTATVLGAQSFIQGHTVLFPPATTITDSTDAFSIRYQGVKRVTPNVTLYSPITGAANNVYYYGNTITSDITVSGHYTLSGNSKVGAYYIAAGTVNTGSIIASSPLNVMILHFIADSRLGIVL